MQKVITPAGATVKFGMRFARNDSGEETTEVTLTIVGHDVQLASESGDYLCGVPGVDLDHLIVR
jgi:hypothetical protein